MRRAHGDGGIDQRGANSWRLRYRVGNQRFAVTFRGTRVEAQRELRRLLQGADEGEHVAPNRITLNQWSQQWLALLGRGLVSARTRERYQELLRLYVLPTLGERPIQQLAATEIDKLYEQLEQRLSVASVRHVHVALSACLKSAGRKIGLRKNPCADADVPRPKEPEVGQALSSAEIKTLLDGFKGSPLFPIVAAALFTGARLGEILALRWSDLDPTAGTLRIERAVEITTEHGLRFKEPKSKRGKRTIEINASLLALLLAEREQYLRMVAGVSDAMQVDLSLVKLPADALLFPSPGDDLAKPRHPKSVTKETRKRFRKLGFPRLRFHDLRGTHGTALLDAGQPVHVVAERLGHDPAVLLKAYARRTRQADAKAASVIEAMAKGML
jgi:integrase